MQAVLTNVYTLQALLDGRLHFGRDQVAPIAYRPRRDWLSACLRAALGPGTRNAPFGTLSQGECLLPGHCAMLQPMLLLYRIVFCLC